MKRIPYTYARAAGVMAEADGRGGLAVIARFDTRPWALAELRRVGGLPLSVQILSADDFEAALSVRYAEGDGGVLADGFGSEADLASLMQDSARIQDLLEADDDAPIIRMINMVFMQALKEGASDIHIEPFENRSLVRFRVDGVLKDVFEPPRALHAALASRIKVMAELDIAEKRLPQDGRIALRLGGRPIDVRVSTLPTGHGERVVLRLLAKDAERLDLERLGMAPDTLQSVDRLIHEPHGILLVTGPTGSGKTTTLYAALSRLDSTELNIMTVEDPIEYDLDGVGQTQVNSKVDMDFARALRAILRQDPDVVLIGEIRDLETAQIAVQASLTGHLVMATLHTNDAVSAVTRLTDMGIEPFLLGSSLIGVLAQRLVRRLCPDCREAYTPSAAEWAALAIDVPPRQVWRAVGCPACNQTGYRGRTGLYELLPVDEPVRRLVHDEAGEHVIREYARAHGLRPLREDALRWLAVGATSIEEILRATRES
ncbi:MAG: type II secretion system ATPase GspE [Gallionellaceae bacterium]|nr:type II secretion system ATPase GspE [Gallionellaceae bacterium]